MKKTSDYDEIKGLLSKVRKIQEIGEAKKSQLLIGEQLGNEPEKEYPEPPDPEIGHDDYLKKSGQLKSFDDDTFVKDPTLKSTPGEEEEEDVLVINNVDVEVHSEDTEDLELSDEEKGKISQLIDDFRKEVAETVEFDKLHIYEGSAKLDGKIPNLGVVFTFSAGDDTGLYLSNTSLLKIDEDSLGMINKLKTFESKFINSINDLLVNRSTT